MYNLAYKEHQARLRVTSVNRHAFIYLGHRNAIIILLCYFLCILYNYLYAVGEL